MDPLIIVCIVLGVISIICAVACLATLSKLRREVSSGNNEQEFKRVREELGASSRDIRSELNRSNADVSEKLTKMTKENYDSRLELTESVNTKLNNIARQNAEQSERQTRSFSEAVARMQEGNEKKLDEMRRVVDEKLSTTLAQRLDSSFKTVSEQLENLYKSLGEMRELSTGMTGNVTALNRMLTNVKSRGVWAEVQLEGILDQTIPGMYVKEYSPNGAGERVEFAVKIPSGEGSEETVYLPIDSKFPLEDYIRLCDAADLADKPAVDAARKALEDRVTAEAKDIKKKYISPPVTTPFAILYLATEGLYAEIASSKNGIMEKLHSEYGILVAGPSTVTALLNSLSVGFKTVALNKRADEVMKLLGAAKVQYEKFGNSLDAVRKNIERAGKSLEDAEGRNRIIQKALRSVENADAVSADALLGSAEDITEHDEP